ncbi:MAG: OmpA family protein [Gammaproteobacteria bacterium]|nr:OmpA family protein [Gammaproteobacteria bacterium]MDH3480371.1 OmpA family protein [Gammaproteobacteria bacterium]
MINTTAFGQTAPDTIITNQAQASYIDPAGNPVTIESNQIDVTTVAIRTLATVTFTRVTASGSGFPVGPTSCAASGGTFQTLPDPVLLGAGAIDPDQPQTLAPTGMYNAGEALFVTLSDLDQNQDPGVRETVEVTIGSAPPGDSETLRLTETDIDSGLFSGYVQTATGPATPGDCILQVSTDTEVTAFYQDPDDLTDSSSAAAIVDPLSIVFDSGSGNAVDGAIVTIIDAVSGAPAVVYGSDGVSSYPSTVTSGGSVSDSSGRVYEFPNGGYRFPVIPAGDYRIEIEPPPGYMGLSTLDMNVLQGLPGAPFVLDGGSFGETFTVDDSRTFRRDLPLDPDASLLYLQKTASVPAASPGDFVPYTLRIENSSAVVQTEVTVTDLLPAGFRLMPGSTRINDAPAPNPVIGSDGRLLSFDIGDLDPGQTTTVRYVTEVTVGATGKTATNTAYANSTSGVGSNAASSTLTLVEDLFTDKATVVGRVILGSCDDNVSNDLEGVGSLGIYMEDGRYAITDEGGRFHFEGLEPGTHVVQLDRDTIPRHLELMDCNAGSRFAGRSYSQFVDLRGGSVWRADFHLRERPLPTGHVALELGGERADSNTIRYALNLAVSDVPVEDLVVSVVLPEGLSYVPGSSLVGGKSADAPEPRGNTISYRLGDKPQSWSGQILLQARLTDDANGALIANAVATFRLPGGETGHTPPATKQFDYRPELSKTRAISFAPHFATLSARLTEKDRLELDTLIADWQGGADAILIATGHTDAHRIAPGHPVFADNHELSLARARAVAAYIGSKLQIADDKLRIDGRGPDEPIASNETAAGRAKNRRVDLRLESRVLVSAAALDTASALSSRVAARTTGTHAIDANTLKLPEVEQAEAAVFSEPGFIETLKPGVRWLAPVGNFGPPIPSLKIAVQHEPGTQVQLSVNGAAVDPLNFVGTEVNRGKNVAISRWRGVDLEEGNNDLTAVVHDAKGGPVDTLKTSVHFGGGPVRAVLDKEASRLIADGRTPPVVALRLFDRYGRPARPSTTGAFAVNAPYRSLWEVEELTKNQLVAVGDREPIYRVGANGIAYLQLEPTTVTGEATVRLKFAKDRTQELRAWIGPALRDWILVGFAEGTIGYNTLKDNMVTAAEAGAENDTYTDGQVSFFAKGQVKGEYLMTLAYQSHINEADSDRQLFGTIDPNRYYTLYGDTTEQRFEAASRRGLFLKIERREFFALFGDYKTGLTVTELSRYDRSLNGLKSEFRGDHFAYTAFASDTDKAFVRDEIIGDGTSGLYYLSASPLVINSDKIELQTRDRFRSEVIVETRPLTRYLDYSIDYATGAILMKRPVPSRDDNFNPIYIVANYETPQSTGQNISAGGRGSWTTGDERLEVGASLIHQGTEGDAVDLIGADLRFKIDEQTEVRAEIASTDSDLAGQNTAMLASLDHQSEKKELRAFYQELETGFGLGQQNRSESGMRKYGVDGRYVWTDHLSLLGAAFRHDNLVDNARQDVLEAKFLYQDSNRNAAVGLMSARDERSSGASSQSDRVFVSGSMGLIGNMFKLRGSGETSLDGESAAGNYPDRLLLGLDYQMTDAALMFGEVESFSGGGRDGVLTRVGVKARPWQSAQLNSTMHHEATEYGPRNFATLGLTQGWQLNEKWYLDFGLDQSRTIGDEPPRVNMDAPPASGNVTGEDFLATFVGALYRSDAWTFTSRTEYRNSDTEERINVLGGFYREQTQGHGFSANLLWQDSEFEQGGSTTLANLRLGWSWRPSDSEWIVYDRIDFIYQNNVSALGDLESWKLVNNLNANWMINRATQLELQYSAKYVRSLIGSDAYTGYTDVFGAGLRRDLNKRWDVGVHGDVRHSWESDVSDFGWGVDVGVTLFDNIWVSAGYNFAGFRDDDFASSNYTAQGPFITFRIKADQDTFRDLSDREETP